MMTPDPKKAAKETGELLKDVRPDQVKRLLSDIRIPQPTPASTERLQ